MKFVSKPSPSLDAPQFPGISLPWLLLNFNHSHQHLCLKNTASCRQHIKRRKMLGCDFHRQIVDSFEVPCGNTGGKHTQSDRWQPTAYSSKFFGEHRSISRTISTFYLLWLPVVVFVWMFEPWIQVTHTSPPLQRQKHGIQTQDYHTEQVCRGASADTMWAGLPGRDCISSAEGSRWKKDTQEQSRPLMWIKSPGRVKARHLHTFLKRVLLRIVRFKESQEQQ